MWSQPHGLLDFVVCEFLAPFCWAETALCFPMPSLLRHLKYPLGVDMGSDFQTLYCNPQEKINFKA